MKIFAGCYLIAGLVSSSGLVAALDSQAHLTPDCTHPHYTIHLFSREPLVIYIADFLTSVEREHLLEASTRRSKSATASRDAVTRCIEERALLFQGYDTPRTHLEPLQLVRYHTNETYDLHTDWFTSPAQTTRSHGGNRLSSFFAYVKASADISGGGTTFPLLDVPKDERWCEYIDCDTPFDEGVTFLPIPGNAVFWVNMVAGRGDQRVIHSGSVVTSGEKVGLNIWTREGPLSPKFRGDIDGEQADEDEDEP
ncbi:oxidoreductase [Fonsecaea pedrosoi]|nr:oxidoreductase [Fonsecaea pedrosoi]